MPTVPLLAPPPGLATPLPEEANDDDQASSVKSDSKSSDESSQESSDPDVVEEVPAYGVEDMQRAQRLRTQIIDCWCTNNWRQMQPLIRRLEDTIVSRQLLANSSLGHLVGMKAIWRNLEPMARQRIDRLCKRWKQELKTMPSKKRKYRTKRPFGDMTPEAFRDDVKDLIDWIFKRPDHKPDIQVARTLGLRLTHHGVHNWRHIQYITDTELPGITVTTPQRLLLQQLRPLAAMDESLESLRDQENRYLQAQLVCPVLSAAEEAKAYNDDTVIKNQEVLQTKKARAGIQGLGNTLRPQQAVRALANAKNRGCNVGELLTAQAEQLVMELRKGSLKATGSAIQTWHKFATEVLDYSDNHTLPPLSEDHIAQWLATFRCWGTASNYISSLRFACQRLRLSMAWDTPTVKMIGGGLRKKNMRETIQKIFPDNVITDEALDKMIRHADDCNDEKFGTFMEAAWKLLARVQSELLPCERGHLGEVTSLPLHRHSAVCLDAQGVLHVRYRQRKNRPGGSLLKRQCTCHNAPAHRCLSHRMDKILAPLKVGEKVFPWTPKQALAKLHVYLIGAEVPDAKQYTFKAFRRGRATDLAARGYSLAHILDLGEWSEKGKAHLKYIRPNAADLQEQIRMAFEDEDTAKPDE